MAMAVGPLSYERRRRNDEAYPGSIRGGRRDGVAGTLFWPEEILPGESALSCNRRYLKGVCQEQHWERQDDR